MSTNAKSGGGFPRWVKMSIAAAIGAGGVTLAAWQIMAMSGPAQVSAAKRADLPGAGMGRRGAGEGDGEGGNKVVINAPDESGDKAPDGTPRMRRIEASSLEDAAKQLGMTPEELQKHMGAGGGERQIVGGPGGAGGPPIEKNPFAGEKGLDFAIPKDDAQAAAMHASLKRAIEAQLGGVVDWGTAPMSTAEKIADAAATALVERLRGGEAWKGAVKVLGGDVRAVMEAPKEGEGAGGAAAGVLNVLDGASLDPNRVSAKRAGAEGPMGMAPTAPAGADGKAPRAVAIMRTMGPGGGEMSMRMPTGGEFPDVQGYGADKLPDVEVEAPLKLAKLEAKPGAARLAVVMAQGSAEGKWQPAAFILKLDEGEAADAFMKTLRGLRPGKGK